jgi:predicted nucleic acid-binding protein
VSNSAPTLYLAEPPAHYLSRPPLVVDCSTVAGIVFSEAWQSQARQQIDGRALHAPHLFHCEIASVAVKKHRRGEPHALRGLFEASEMAIDLHPVDPVAVAELALRYQLSAYDAAYLWLAADLKCPLATFDDKLAAAARAHLASLP